MMYGMNDLVEVMTKHTVMKPKGKSKKKPTPKSAPSASGGYTAASGTWDVSAKGGKKK
jgi:hypothetical protein